jgi:hypothetical protein
LIVVETFGNELTSAVKRAEAELPLLFPARLLRALSPATGDRLLSGRRAAAGFF